MIGLTKSHSARPQRSRVIICSAGLVLGFGLFSGRGVAQSSDGTFGLSEAAAAYSFSPEADVERGGKIGSVKISHYDFETSFSLPAPATWRFSSAVAVSRDDFSLTGNVPLPDKLESVGLGFTAIKDLTNAWGHGWTFMGMLRPTFASAGGDFSGHSANFSAIAALGKQASADFGWSLGVIGEARGKNRVLPFVSVRWKFAPDWGLVVGFPRTGISYQVNASLQLNAGLSFQGGTYYVKDAPAAGLGQTYLEYREFRPGLAAEYQFSKELSLGVEGGVALSRSFDYYDRGVKLDGKSTSYGRIALRYRF